MKKYISKSLLCATALLLFVSCSESFLTQEPGGASITEAQAKAMDNFLRGSVLGIYTNMYAYGGEHDAFGQRSIDMYGDLLCGDMALKTQNYGWFSSDELMQTSSQRRSYYWSYYYVVARACNKTINIIDDTENGRPQLDFDAATITDEEYENGYYFAELLALRGWAYSGLLRHFVKPHDIDMSTELAVPVYTEDDTKADTILGAPRYTVEQVYQRIEQDFKDAILYFEAYFGFIRDSKIEMNVDIARILLAYSYLNKGDNTNALKYAKDAIENTSANILPFDEVLTTGFNNVDNNNWIWGEDVTVQNTTSLASFFGQCDIFSYSYASAGDVKGIDENLYKSIPAWDIRKLWWSNYSQTGAKNASSYEFAPDGKFYSATSVKLQGDRDWLSDNVFMRLELAYLIAAEAACRLNDDVTAKDYLYAITDERVLPGQETAYSDWQTSLSSNALLLEAIRYNWRVELWGEGYGLQTFKRFNVSVTLGENHLRSTKTISPDTPSPRTFTFEIPTDESYYNPYIRQTTELEKQ